MICGVVLEGHLSTVAQRHGIILEQHRRTIGALNKRLSEKNILDHTMSKLISYLGEIRNRCAHKSDRDPTPEEIEDLIAKTERVIKEVF
jgi:uncharacterized protein (UPF0332 family)